MNFFSNTGDLTRGMMNIMNNNNWSAGNQKEVVLRTNLQSCTYADETKYVIEKAIKQVFHVYPFFNADIIMFNEGSFQRRYMELKGILEIDIKSKTCKVDFNMMLPNNYPHGAPYVRIVNRNSEYKVDPYYESLQSKTDKSSYILNEKLTSWKNWHPSSSLVNVVIECYDMLKTRFPFSKPVTQNSMYGVNKSSPWDEIYNKNNNQGGWGNNSPGWSSNPVNANNNWPSNNNNWPNTANNNWPNTGNNNWGNPNNDWGSSNNVQWGGNFQTVTNSVNSIAAAQKLVAKQKQSLIKINALYAKVIDKSQHLDMTKQSMESQESILRRQNFQMTNFLSVNEHQSIPDLTSIVKPSNDLSEQILDLLSSLKAREDCVTLLENRFNQEQVSLEDFMKQLRKLEQSRFEERFLLQKCVKHAS